MSKIFNCILDKVCKKIVVEPFKVLNVNDCLGSSKSFLAKHSIDPDNANKKVYGKSYFIRVSRGEYKINPEYKICS